MAFRNTLCLGVLLCRSAGTQLSWGKEGEKHIFSLQESVLCDIFNTKSYADKVSLGTQEHYTQRGAPWGGLSVRVVFQGLKEGVDKSKCVSLFVMLILCPVCWWMFGGVSVVCFNLILILCISWTLQSKEIHVLTACTVMTPTHDWDRRTFDWWGFEKRLNDRNKSGLRGQAGFRDVCNTPGWSSLMKEQLHLVSPNDILSTSIDAEDLCIGNGCQKLYDDCNVAWV